MTTFVPERGPDGKIVIGQSPLDALYADTRSALSGAAVKEEAAPPSHPAVPAIPRQVQIALAGGAGLLLVFVLSFLIGALSSSVPAAAPAPPAPSVVASPQASAAAPAPAQIVAFAAPGGDVLGPVATGNAYHFVGRYGDAWLQSDVPGSGRIWVRRAGLRLDQDDLAATAKVPDLAPPPTPVPPPPPTPREPAPTQCAVVQTNTASASACGLADLDTLQTTAQARLMADQHLRSVAVTTATPYGG